MIECDYFIIGMGVSGIGLKYKLKGKVILVDYNPFSYKIGESHIPNFLHSDFSILEKIAPKLNEKLESYQLKKGTIFSDSSKELYQNSAYTELHDMYAFHCERIELEKLLVKELNIGYKNEKVIDIDFDNNIVTTNKNEYKVKNYILDCSGPRMFIADKLGLVEKIPDWNKTYATWGYWDINKIDEKSGKVDEYTLLNKIDENTWIWQIPLFGGKILSSGIVSMNKIIKKDEYISLVEEYRHSYYKNISLRNDTTDLGKIHNRNNYAKIASKVAGKNYILLGDAYCFADPIFSVGTGVSMSEAIYLADTLNKGEFNVERYEIKSKELIETLLGNFTSWYSEDWKNDYVLANIQENALQGGILNKTLGTLDSTLETYISLISGFEGNFTGTHEKTIDESEIITFFHEGLYKFNNDKLEIGYHGVNSKKVEVILNKNIINFLNNLKLKVISFKNIIVLGKKILSDDDLKYLLVLLNNLKTKRIIPIYYKK